MTGGNRADRFPGSKRTISRRTAGGAPPATGTAEAGRARGPREVFATGRPEARPELTRADATALTVKRGLDVVGATTALIVLSPVLAWTALAVAATQGLPILFRHERPGFQGRPFTLYKFRTMRAPRG